VGRGDVAGWLAGWIRRRQQLRIAGVAALRAQWLRRGGGLSQKKARLLVTDAVGLHYRLRATTLPTAPFPSAWQAVAHQSSQDLEADPGVTACVYGMCICLLAPRR
jgi:hypothetical protein